jgi:hypothetical protein
MFPYHSHNQIYRFYLIPLSTPLEVPDLEIAAGIPTFEHPNNL